MRYTGLHGSPGGAFERFDMARSGEQSGYDHARGVACFTSEFEVAQSYAEGTGFVGRFSFTLDNPLELDDSERPMGIASFLEQAREGGHDGVILRRCSHTALSPGGESDLFFVFDASSVRRIEVLQEPEEMKPARGRR